MPDGLRIWLLSLLVPDRWEEMAGLVAHFHVDLAMVFLGFYGMLTVLCLVILALGMSLKGLSRGMAFACVMLCLVLGGAVASFSVLQARSDEGRREQAVKEMRAQVAEMKRNRPPVAPIQPKSMSPDEVLEKIRREQAEREKRMIMTPQEAHRRWHEEHDREGNLLEDDFSHEESYPRRDAEY